MPAMSGFADFFAPDVNFTSARAVYPTAPGGTTAGAAGAMTPTTSVYVSDPSAPNGEPGVTVDTPGAAKGSGKGLWYWFGFVLLLVLTVWIARKAGSPEDFRTGNLKPSFYNFLTITLTAIIGIVGLKVLAAKYKVPGMSEVILAV